MYLQTFWAKLLQLFRKIMALDSNTDKQAYNSAYRADQVIFKSSGTFVADGYDIGGTVSGSQGTLVQVGTLPTNIATPANGCFTKCIWSDDNNTWVQGGAFIDRDYPDTNTDLELGVMSVALDNGIYMYAKNTRHVNVTIYYKVIAYDSPV